MTIQTPSVTPETTDIEISPIPLATIRSLFCLDLPSVYKNRFDLDIPPSADQTVGATTVKSVIANYNANQRMVADLASQMDDEGNVPHTTAPALIRN